MKENVLDGLKAAKDEFGQMLFQAIESERVLEATVWDIDVSAKGGHYVDIAPFLDITSASIERNLTENPLPELTNLLPVSGSFEIPMNLLNTNIILHLSTWNWDRPDDTFDATASMYFQYDRDYPNNIIRSPLSLDLILELVDRLGIVINSASLDLHRGYRDGVVREYEEMFSRILGE